MTTSYKIAETAMDYTKAHALIRNEGQNDDFQLSFPTILAMEDDEVVGVLGTNVTQKYILAGPLVLKSDRKRSFTIIRLVELYDATMRAAGIRSFIFATDLSNTRWLEYIDKVLGFKPYTIKHGKAWFIRNLKEA